MHILKLIILLVCVSSNALCADLTSLFKAGGSGTSGTSLNMEIAFKKVAVVVSEPTNIYIKISNNAKTPIAIPLGWGRQSSNEVRLLLSNRNELNYHINKARDDVFIIVPPQSSIYCSVPDVVFDKTGTIDVSLEYKIGNTSMTSFFGIKPWNGTLLSNTVHLLIAESISATGTANFDKKIAMRNINLWTDGSSEQSHNYQNTSTFYLINHAPDSVEFILSSLSIQDERVRRHLLSTLRKIVSKGKLESEAQGMELLDSIIADMLREKQVYGGYGTALLIELQGVYFKGNLGVRKKITKSFMLQINTSANKKERAAATLGLLHISPADGYYEIFKDNRIARHAYVEGKANAFYDLAGWREILNLARKKAGLSNMTSVDELENWWSKNKNKDTFDGNQH